MTKINLSWKFPEKHTAFLRIEIFFLVLLAILIFLYTAFQFEKKIFSGLAFALLFVIIYLFVSHLTKRVRKVEEIYKVIKSDLHITKKTKSATKKSKVSLKQISLHKLDKLFLGGYLVTKKGKKHVLFFNVKDEIEKFERLLLKHIKRA